MQKKVINGCPACDLIRYRTHRYKTCGKCGHIYTSGECENCNSNINKSKGKMK